MIPPSLINSKDICTLHHLKSYMTNMGNLKFVISDSKKKGSIDAKLLFHFAKMRKLINEEGYMDTKEDEETLDT